jgi:hypothetical protein
VYVVEISAFPDKLLPENSNFSQKVTFLIVSQGLRENGHCSAKTASEVLKIRLPGLKSTGYKME